MSIYIDFEDLRKTFYGDEFEEYLKYILNCGELENEERDKGIIRKVLEEGYESLSKKQQNCFDFGIIKNNYTECAYCGTLTTWSKRKYMLAEDEEVCDEHEGL